MPAVALESLEEVMSRLKGTYFAADDLKLAPVCTRVMLRTGADLRAPDPQQSRDPAVIAQVVACLAEMGYPL